MRQTSNIVWNKHNSLSLAVALVLPSVVYALATPQPVYRFIIPAFIAIVGVALFLFWKVSAQTGEERPWALMRSGCFYVSWLCLFSLVPSPEIRIWYSLISVPVLFAGQAFVLYAGETVLVTHTILSAIGILLGAAAGEFYFKAGSGWLTLGVFAAELCMALATYAFIPQAAKVRLFAALVVALLGTELYTAALFLPFHYTVVGFLAFEGFYVLWLLTYFWQYGTLTSRRAQFYMTTALVLATAVLLATPWRIMR